jgi:hypothetical protein
LIGTTKEPRDDGKRREAGAAFVLRFSPNVGASCGRSTRRLRRFGLVVSA